VAITTKAGWLQHASRRLGAVTQFITHLCNHRKSSGGTGQMGRLPELQGVEQVSRWAQAVYTYIRM